MQKILPIYYSEYGRYINRFRAIPFYVDCLKPVERRILLTLHEVAKGPKFVKSAKVVGNAISSYHPHGDQSCYGTLIQLVQQSYAIGKGNWSSKSLHDDNAAAYRYTECKISPWIEDLAFTYIDYVPWLDVEYESEPLYLPSPIPVGLIGDGITIGVTFYRTVVPKYKLKDLATRLIWLLEQKLRPTITTELLEQSKMSEKLYGPCIVPNFKGCTSIQNLPNQYYSLLMNGTGSISAIPLGTVENKHIKISGRAPNMSFSPNKESKKDSVKRTYLTDDADDKDKLDVVLRDLSENNNIEIWVEPRKRNIDLNQMANHIWKKYLIKRFNFNIIVCDNDGIVNTTGIDDLLLNNYQAWKYAVLLKKAAEYEKLNNRKFEYVIVQIIRNIFEEIKATSLDQIIKRFKEYQLKNGGQIAIEIESYDVDKSIWYKQDKEITEKEITEICTKRNIRNLIETIIDTNKIDLELVSAKNAINNVDRDCMKYTRDLLN